MRLNRFLNEEDIIKKGLSIPEPEVGKEYSEDEVKSYVTVLEDAINAQEKKGSETEADDAVFRDLKDKLEKWENLDSSTKAAGPVIPAIDVLAAQPPEGEAGDEAPPEEEEEDPKKKKDKKKE